MENIYVKNINMKDIPGEAILFDMYYAAQDPIAIAGEKREPPKVETMPVTEATPQFNNFFFDNFALISFFLYLKCFINCTLYFCR